jgi:hypothetical protein
MKTAESTVFDANREARPTTLLDLVWSASESTPGEDQLVAGVAGLLRSGRVRLTGNFRGVPVDQLLAGGF